MNKQSKRLPAHVRETDVLAALLKVNPTADMPRPGSQPSTPRKAKRKPKRAK